MINNVIFGLQESFYISYCQESLHFMEILIKKYCKWLKRVNFLLIVILIKKLVPEFSEVSEAAKDLISNMICKVDKRLKAD